MELKKYNILGKDYKITDKLPKSAKEFSPNNYMGVCMDDTAHIFLSPSLREGEEYWTTLFHELGHAIMYRNGVRFSGAVPMELEEILVETFAQSYYSVFKQLLKRLDKHGAYHPIREDILSFCRDTK